MIIRYLLQAGECHHHQLPGEECQPGQLRPVEGRVDGQVRLVELNQVGVVMMSFLLLARFSDLMFVIIRRYLAWTDRTSIKSNQWRVRSTPSSCNISWP